MKNKEGLILKLDSSIDKVLYTENTWKIWKICGKCAPETSRDFLRLVNIAGNIANAYKKLYC